MMSITRIAKGHGHKCTEMEALCLVIKPLLAICSEPGVRYGPNIPLVALDHVLGCFGMSSFTWKFKFPRQH